MRNEFEMIVRALIIKDHKILVCQTHGRNYYFLPGGHVEFGETMRQALVREIKEEMGVRVTRAEFIGGVENIFVQDGRKKHETSFVFLTNIDRDEVTSQESHVSFYWFTYSEFIERNIVPPALRDAVIRFLAEKETFFIESSSN